MLSQVTWRRVATRFLALIAVAVYLLMWLGYRQGWGWLDTVDSWLLSMSYDVGVKHPVWVRSWDGLCTAFAPLTFRLLGAVAIGVALAHRRARVAVFVLISVELSGLISQAAKGLADRPRPVTALAAASSSSFPSGHAAGAMVGVAALLTVLLPLLSHSARPMATGMGALMVLAVGFGRVALNVHHPSDVLAGWALGYLYFLLCRWVVRPMVDSAGPPGNTLDLDE